MSFYTNVCRYGNTILYRGYNNHAKRIYKRDSEFMPVFYQATNTPTGWTGLDGNHVKPHSCDNMREAKQWLEDQKVPGRPINRYT